MPNKPKQSRKYFSLAEWYGEDLAKLTTAQKTANAELAISKKTKVRPCPFRPGRTCYKGGGVCTFRAYSREAASENIGLGNPVTVCPWRFFDGGEVFKWVGEVMLGTGTPRILGEIPFLQKLKPVGLPAMESSDADEDDDFIGRIDNILVHPSDTAGLNWCALELQAVYFSGKAMSSEFKEILNNPDGTYFPVEARHPDYRSSGPKRLLPQLQTKVPELITWGKKMAVCVDEAFFAQLVGIERATPANPLA